MEQKKRRRRTLFQAFSLLLLLLLLIGGIFLVKRLNSTPSLSQAKQTTPTSIAGTQGTVEPLFTDKFSDNSKGWSLGEVAGYTRLLHNNMLTLADTKHNVLVESIPTSTTFDDFSITTTFTLTQADKNDSVGLYVRGDSNLDHDYRIDIFGNTTYAISKEALNSSNDLGQTFLVPPSHTNAIHPIGQRNVLTVAMKGPAMVVQMNGKTLHTLADTDYTHGQIALFVANGTSSSGVTATFHDIVIYSVPNRLPG